MPPALARGDDARRAYPPLARKIRRLLPHCVGEIWREVWRWLALPDLRLWARLIAINCGGHPLPGWHRPTCAMTVRGNTESGGRLRRPAGGRRASASASDSKRFCCAILGWLCTDMA